MHKLKSRYIKLTATKRIYNSEIPVIGITGGIATGKSTVGSIVKSHGFFLIDADKLIKNIYKLPQTIEFIKELSPEAIDIDSNIDFVQLRKSFFSDASIKNSVEDYLYKELPSQFSLQIQNAKNQGQNFVFYEIPLLFEKELHSKLDLTVCVYAPQDLQVSRTQKRDNNSIDLIHKILDNQINIEHKKELADFIIENTQSLNILEKQVSQFLKNVTE